MNFSTDDMQSKLIMLFMLEKIEMPLTEQTIIDICNTQNDWISYMDCKEILFQLINNDFIYPTENAGANEETYFITSQGQECLSLFYQKIPEKLRDEISEYVRANRLHFKKSQEYIADYSRNNDGSYLVSLKICSHTVNYPMFEIKITTSSRQSAIEACKKWRENAHLVYEQVYESLINFNEDEQNEN